MMFQRSRLQRGGLGGIQAVGEQKVISTLQALLRGSVADS
jgi:hypothetical protein